MIKKLILGNKVIAKDFIKFAFPNILTIYIGDVAVQ